MNARFVAVAIVLALLVCNGLADENKPRKHKKARRPHHAKHPVESAEKDAFQLMEADDAADALRAQEEKHRLAELDREVERAREQREKDEAELERIADNKVPFYDPCTKVHCGAGRVCEVDELGDPRCVCIQTCPDEQDIRRHVCTNHNETWGSDCAVYQHRCWCDSGDERCKGSQFKHVHIEYYGVCREMPACADEEMADFPRRMRDWLFNIMRDLADRQELTPHYLKMEREAETNMTRRWSNAAIWKWCDLDGHPHDRSISRHELFPIRAPLMSLEHCIAPFLDGCDVDNDHRISLSEWTKCLEIEEGDVEERCEEINGDDDK